MYIKYFKMDQEPFSVRPKTEFFFASPAHQQTLELLKTSIEYGEPLILVHGEYGAGKTLVCLKLLEELGDLVSYIYFSSSDVTWREILRKMLNHLGVSDIKGIDESEMKSRIFDLYGERPETPPVYLLFDDFQETDESIIYHLRKIINFNINGIFPIRLILIAHTSFLKKMQDDPALEPFLQRLRRRIQLRPLSDEEMREYIYFRLFNAGARGKPIFSDGALKLIKQESRCIPRLINNICDAALIVAARSRRDTIDEKVIQAALELYNISEDKQTKSIPQNNIIDNMVREPVSYEQAFNFTEAYRHNSTPGTAGGPEPAPSFTDTGQKSGKSRNSYSSLTVILVILLTAAITYIVVNNMYQSSPEPPETTTQPALQNPAKRVTPNTSGTEQLKEQNNTNNKKNQAEPTKKTGSAATDNYSYRYELPKSVPPASNSNDRSENESSYGNLLNNGANHDKDWGIEDPLAGEAMIPFTTREESNGI
jgi:MSHA biogenesis protein MshM